MLRAYLRALGQLSDRRIVRLCLLAALLAVAVFVLAWLGAVLLLRQTTLTEIDWLEGLLDWLGVLAPLPLVWLLWPAVFGSMLGLFLDAAAAAVERRHYPELPPAPGLPLLQAAWASLRFLAVLLAANLLLLLLLLPTLLLPALFPLAYYLVNGWLLGREYFELVALRRLKPAPARALRRRHPWALLSFGIATALLLTVPVVALAVPVLGTMAMVHMFEPWRRRELDGADGAGAA